MKPAGWIVVLLAGIGAIWLFRDSLSIHKLHQGAKVGKSDPAVRTPTDVSTTTIRDGEVPESPRHLAGEIEKHKSEREQSKPLEEAIREQKTKVEAHRAELARIVQSIGIIYTGPNESYSGETPVTDPSDAKVEFDKPGAESYVGAKKRFEEAQELLREMQQRLAAGKSKTSGRTENGGQ